MVRRRYAVMGIGLAAAVLITGVSAGAHQAQAGGTAFTPLSPTRVLDTRVGTGTGGSTSPVGPRGTIVLDLSAKVPASASAVVLNVTGVTPTANTFITVYPDGGARPTASNLNLVPGQIRPNGVTVALSAARKIDLYNNAGSTHLIADLAGYYSTDQASLFTPVSPDRVLDTRNTGGALGPGGTRTVDFSSRVPASATAVTFNLTGVGATAGTFISAYPGGTARPPVSSLNLTPGEITPNLVTVALGANKTVTLYNNTGSTHLIVDLAGYYASNTGLPFHRMDPLRFLDTRPDKGVTPDFYLELDLTEGGAVPADATAVVGNLTGVSPPQSTFVRVFGNNESTTSNLNLVPGQIAANQITVELGAPESGAGRLLHVFNNSGYVDVIVDLAGYFAP